MLFEDLILKIAYSIDKKYKTVEDGSIQVRDAGVEALAELKHRLESLSEDRTVQQKLNASIADLGEENAKLKERIQNREMESFGAKKALNEVQQELQQCRAQLCATNEDLGKAVAASREDALLRTQLQDLQTSYSIVKQQAESSARETERVRADVREQENLTLLAQQENSELQGKLQHSEARVSGFDDQKEAYVHQLKSESNMLRVQMERDVRARLAEDEARHSGIISGLRRQITETDDKLSQAQRKLHDLEKMTSNKESEAHKCSKHLSAVATELGSLQDKSCSMEYGQDEMDSELSISQEQLRQYLEKAADWSARAEQNALEFANRRKEIDDALEKSEKVAEVEIDRLEALVLALQKKIENSDTVISKVASYLRSRGVIRPDLAFTDWAIGLPGEESQQETNIDPSQPSAIGVLHDAPVLNQEICNRGSQNSVGISTASICNTQANISLQSADEYTSRATNPSRVLFEENCKARLSETENSLLLPYSKSSIKPGCSTYQYEHDLNMVPLESTSAPNTLYNVPKSSPATKVTSRFGLRANDHLGDSKVLVKSTKKLEGASRTVIPDSQEGLMRESAPTFARPPQRVAERRQGMAESNRTVTRTEITGYSIRTSEMCIGAPTVQHNDPFHVPFRNQATDMRSTDSDGESSGLSEPPDNVDKLDFADFMDNSDGRDRKDPTTLRFSDQQAYAESMASHTVLSPKPNSGRARTGARARPQEPKQPKGILKRTNNVIHINDASANACSGGKPLANSLLPKMQGIQAAAAAHRGLSKTMSDTNGREGSSHRSLYNRPVAGSKDLQKSNHFQVHNVPPQVQGPSVADIFNVSSSPAMEQPKRNSKKRALSGVGINESNKPAKIPRSVRR
jgi:predicted  nucleic acid-binding Zn-ribbon protein